MGCGHRSPALLLRPLLHGTCPYIAACEHIYRHRISEFAFNAYWFPAIFLDRSWRRHFAVPSLDCPSTACPSVDGTLDQTSVGDRLGGLFAHRAFLRLCKNRSSDQGCGSRGRNETTIAVLVIIATAAQDTEAMSRAPRHTKPVSSVALQVAAFRDWEAQQMRSL